MFLIGNRVTHFLHCLSDFTVANKKIKIFLNTEQPGLKGIKEGEGGIENKNIF